MLRNPCTSKHSSTPSPSQHCSGSSVELLDISFNHDIKDTGIAALANAVVERFQHGHIIEIKREGALKQAGKKLFAALLKINSGGTQIDISGDELGDACAAVIVLPLFLGDIIGEAEEGVGVAGREVPHQAGEDVAAAGALVSLGRVSP